MNIKDLEILHNKAKESEENTIDLDSFNLSTITCHSTSIEGSTYSIDETFFLLKEGLVIGGKTYEETSMVKDHHNALNYIISLSKEKKEIDIPTLKEINKIINKNTGKVVSNIFGIVNSENGDFRNSKARAGSRGFKHENIEERTKELLDNFNKKIKVLSSYKDISILSYEIHYNIVDIHPFLDGNGRTSRLLQNYTQLYHNLIPTIVHKEDKFEYYKVLGKTDETGDKNIFIDFMNLQSEKYYKSLLGIE